LTSLDTVLELLHAKCIHKDSRIETFSVSIVLVCLFSAWFGVFGLIISKTNEVRGAGLLVILFIRNEYERLKFVDLSGTFVLLLQHFCNLSPAGQKIYRKDGNRRSIRNTNHDATIPQNLVKTTNYSG
jgi:hypothetical protein